VPPPISRAETRLENKELADETVQSGQASDANSVMPIRPQKTGAT
jgi:hypothetical protein